MDQVANLAGGCFWCTEAIFDELRGVKSVESGYMGGKTPNPRYDEVCSGSTGHAELVRVTFDPDEVSFKDLLGVFFATHDPTTPFRQGNDVGTQYRSAIFYENEEQKRDAEEVIRDLTAGKVFSAPIVTEVTLASQFHVAEDYHQEYFQRVGTGNPYCAFVVEPKVAKFRKHFVEKLKRK